MEETVECEERDLGEVWVKYHRSKEHRQLFVMKSNKIESDHKQKS